MNQKELDLDKTLADLAEDIPPMPADFHDKWMNAVRAEAEQAEKPIPVFVSRWLRIFSIAAVFVFLIGGTFVYRSVRKTSLPEYRPASTAAVTETVVKEEALEAEAPDQDIGEMVFEAAGSAIEANSSAGDDLAVVAAGRKEISKAAETATAVMADKGTPSVKPSATNTLAAEVHAAEKPETAPAEQQGIDSFFTDMGDFLLAVWPYLLIIAVPLAVAAGMKKFRKK